MALPRAMVLAAMLALGADASANQFTPDTSTAISNIFPAVNGEVFAIATVSDKDGNGTIYIAGSFTEVGGATRNNAAAFDIATGALTAWNPNLDGPVRALVVAGDSAYLGGDFGSGGGQTRNNLASVNLTDGAVQAWNPNVNGEVHALAFAGGSLHAGGDFSMVGGEARARFASFGSGLVLQPWNPGADGKILALNALGSVLYIGGDFQNIAGAPRPYAAAIDAANGTLLGWNPAPNGIVRALASKSTVFAGGDFTGIGGRSIAYAASLDPVSGLASTWDPSLNGPVRAIHLFYKAAYLGGDFTTSGGTPRAHLAALHIENGFLFAWNPGANAAVNALFFQGNIHPLGGPSKSAILLGGAFTTADGSAQQGFALARDPMWTSDKWVRIDHINGKPFNKARRVRYTTRRHRVTLSGTAGSYTKVAQVFIVNRADRKKRKAVTAVGTDSWRATLRLRAHDSFFELIVTDAHFDFIRPLRSYGLRVTRLDRGEKMPRK